LLVNSVAELGLACMLCQELKLLTCIRVLLYILVRVGWNGSWRLYSYPLGRGKKCSLLAGRLRLCWRQESRVSIEGWRLGPALSLWWLWESPILMDWANIGSVDPITLLWPAQLFSGSSPVQFAWTLEVFCLSSLVFERMCAWAIAIFNCYIEIPFNVQSKSLFSICERNQYKIVLFVFSFLFPLCETLSLIYSTLVQNITSTNT
jgi:uncharacterized protein (DUF486 family)